MAGSLMNGKLERMWKEAVVSYLKMLFRHYPDYIEKIYKNPQKGDSVSRREFEPDTSRIKIVLAAGISGDCSSTRIFRQP
jgi:hypothetical protein